MNFIDGEILILNFLGGIFQRFLLIDTLVNLLSGLDRGSDFHYKLLDKCLDKFFRLKFRSHSSRVHLTFN